MQQTWGELSYTIPRNNIIRKVDIIKSVHLSLEAGFIEKMSDFLILFARKTDIRLQNKQSRLFHNKRSNRFMFCEVLQ